MTIKTSASTETTTTAYMMMVEADAARIMLDLEVVAINNCQTNAAINLTMCRRLIMNVRRDVSTSDNECAS